VDFVARQGEKRRHSCSYGEHFQQEQTSFATRKADGMLTAKGTAKLFKLFFYRYLDNGLF